MRPQATLTLKKIGECAHAQTRILQGLEIIFETVRRAYNKIQKTAVQQKTVYLVLSFIAILSELNKLLLN